MQIPGFESLTEIGRGGFGVVYRAPQPGFGRDVAIKVLSTPVAQTDARARARFERETATTGKLSGHPHIVTLHHAGFTDDGRPYLVMALLEGGSLGDRLQRSGPLTWQEALPIGVKVAGALATAHAAGIVHRDVKPDNILVDDFGAPVLSDFGIASAAGLDGGQVTATGQLTMTVAYSPPELLDGVRPDERTDTFALGATLFALLTGHPPFARPGDETVARIMARMVSEDAPDLTDHGVPPAAAAAIARALDRDPTTRTPTAVALGQDLQDALASLGQPAVAMVLPQAADVGGEAERTLALPSLDLDDLPGTTTPDPAPDDPSAVLVHPDPDPHDVATQALGGTPATTPTAAIPPAVPRTPTQEVPPAAAAPAAPHGGWVDPGPPPRRSGVGAAVAGILVGLALLTVAGVGWLWLNQDDPAAGPTGGQVADADPTTEPTTGPTPPVGAGPGRPITTPQAPDVVLIADHPDGPGIAATLQRWQDGINDGAYEQAWATYSTGLQQRVPLERFRDGNATSTIEGASIVSITPAGPARVAVLGFRSTQDPDLGPDGQDCSEWSLTWRLLPADGGWVVDDVSARNGAPIAC